MLLKMKQGYKFYTSSTDCDGGKLIW